MESPRKLGMTDEMRSPADHSPPLHPERSEGSPK